MSKKVVWAVIVVVAAVGLFFAVGGRKQAEPKYRTATVDRGSITQTVTATGALSAVTTVQVGSQVSGIIARLHADFNSKVKKGEVLAELDPTPFQEKINQTEAALEKAKVDMRNAGINLQRQTALKQQGLAPQADYDQAQANYDGSKAAVAQAQATLNQSKTDMRNSKIVAPIDGVVVARQYDVGQTVAASFQAPTLFTIAQDLTKMQVSTDVSESDIGQVRVGQPVRFMVDAYPDRQFRGTVSQIRLNATVNQNVVTYPVIVGVENPDLSLRPTMTANVTVDVATVRDVLRVPNSALRWRPEEKPGTTSEDRVAARQQQGTGVQGSPAGASGAGSQSGTAAMAKQFGQTGGGRGSGSERFGGPGAGRFQTATVYEPAGSKGEPKPVQIRSGITDGRFTQIVSGEVKPGDTVIIGLATSKVTTTGASPMGGPGGGRKGF